MHLYIYICICITTEILDGPHVLKMKIYGKDVMPQNVQMEVHPKCGLEASFYIRVYDCDVAKTTPEIYLKTNRIQTSLSLLIQLFQENSFFLNAFPSSFIRLINTLKSNVK